MAIPVSELQKASPSSVIELFQLVINAAQHGTDAVYCFHAGTNLGGAGDLIFNGVTFTRFPVEAEGFEYSGNGELPRPKIRVSNVLGTMTAIILTTPRGLEGAQVIRLRTLARYLDAANFPARRNLLTTTSGFTGSWLKGAGLAGFFTAVTSDIYSPAGELDAVKFESTSITSQGLFLRATQSQGAATRTLSLHIYVPSQAGVTSWALNLDGADSSDTGDSATFTEFDTWVRVTVPIVYTATRSFLDFNIRRNGVAPAASGFVFHAWGAQLEAGTTRTDYQAIGATFSQNPFGTPDPTAEFPREVYYIDRKTTENREVVEYELTAAFDLAGVRLPKRQCIANMCPWVYRSAECGYTGSVYFNEADQQVGTLAQDVCGKKFISCLLRFGASVDLPFGGFPGVGTYYT